MKHQRERRRKLRFNSTKDATPVVSAKVESSSKQPIKKHKRQHYPRHTSPATTRPGSIKTHVSSLPTTTWSDIQAQFTAATSLGEITRTVLQFFKKHETLQGSASGPMFPLFVPSSDIYKMEVPRKRRIYDVLHVLEGIGVIKRVRCDETQKTKAGFLYNGEAAVVQHLTKMQRNATQAIVKFRQSRRSKPVSIVEEDSAIVKVMEKLAAIEKWPCLVNTTTCFLSLLFQHDDQVGVALPNMSARLIEAKKCIGDLVPLKWNENSCKDVHRRVYDVVSVLESCSLVFTSTTSSMSLKSSCDKRNPRKSVRFNYGIFTDARLLFAGCNAAHSSDVMWNTSRQDNVLEITSTIFDAVSKGPKSRAQEDNLVSPPSGCWQNLRTVTARSPMFAQVDGQVSDTGNCGDTKWESPILTRGKAATNDTSWNVQSKYRPEAPLSSCVRVFFSPLGKEPTEKNEWYDDSLKQLRLYALPVQDKIDWDHSKQFTETYRETWGQYHDSITCHAFTQDQVWIDGVDVQVSECHGVVVNGYAKSTPNFFC